MSEERNIHQLHDQPASREGSFAEPRFAVHAKRAIYFIGIGGIGMSAIARYFHTQGYRVSGYDKTSTPLTQALESSGMLIHYNEDLERIPKDVEVVVYTPAVPPEHKELVYYRKHGYNVIKRSDVLKIITESSFNICVGGTHGKTTVSSMIAIYCGIPVMVVMHSWEV